LVGNGTSAKERIPKHFGNPNHYSCFALSGSRLAPVCADAVASHLFLDGAATPFLYQQGNGQPEHSFAASSTAPAENSAL
jgi:hypothetical protein